MRYEPYWTPKRERWDALELLGDLTPEMIHISDIDREALEPYLWADVASEYDSRHLSEEIARRSDRWTTEFLLFWEAWLADEYNHFRGFQRLYSLIYGESEESIERRLALRTPDFSRIGAFIEDEFKLCLVIAYDEIATTRAYAADAEFYTSLGPPALKEWQRRLTADEALHYRNLLEILKLRHAHRADEADAVLEEIFSVDRSSGYTATFVLDHDFHVDQFSEPLLRRCINIIKDKLAVAAR
jgi:hypothetical protein